MSIQTQPRIPPFPGTGQTMEQFMFVCVQGFEALAERDDASILFRGLSGVPNTGPWRKFPKRLRSRLRKSEVIRSRDVIVVRNYDMPDHVSCIIRRQSYTYSSPKE